MYAIIDRWGTTPDGVFGEFIIAHDGDELFRAFTVEQPWNNNKPFHSCIPSGNYQLKPFYSEKYGHTFCIIGNTVSEQQQEGYERFACLIHAANKASELAGCVALGKGRYFDGVEKVWAVGPSKDTVGEALNILNQAANLIDLTINAPITF